MPIFKSKPGPLLRPSRAIHIAWGAVGVEAGIHIFGPEHGAVIGGAIATVGGVGWEVLNHWWPKGYHMYGDVNDAIAFFLGAFATGVIGRMF